MIELLDTSPDVDVQPAEYQRLLGYPRDHVLSERAAELAKNARAWYAEHGRPWIHARQANDVGVCDDIVTISGVPFESKRLAAALRDAGADRVVLVAVSAGPELEAESQRLWRDEKPDEYFFLEIFGSAVVEHLVMIAGGGLCAQADRSGLAVLPHYSPGYPDWSITDQARLLELIASSPTPLPGGISVLESGMLRPKKSLLAVFGITPHADRVRSLAELVPCEGCSLPRCQYRRAAFRKPRRLSEVEAMRQRTDEAQQVAATPPPIQVNGKYTLSTKALKRWSAERLTLLRNSDGSVHATFRYDGTTCSNTGREFRFLYTVTLGRREERYPIVSQRCEPVPGDEGHAFMCRYRAIGASFLDTINEERPLAGQPIDDVLTWNRTPVAASCYCDTGSARHKWGMVLETLHYAIAELEKDMISPNSLIEAESR